jgi:hypothetical protein
MVNLNELLKGIFSNDFENKTKLDLAFDFSDQFPIADFLKQRIKIKLQTINVSQVTLNVGTQSLTCTKIKKHNFLTQKDWQGQTRGVFHNDKLRHSEFMKERTTRM